jgi:hypothetical protein
VEKLIWILGSGFLMSVIALSGSLLFFLRDAVFARLILPLVAVAAGSLIGGAFFHMFPAALSAGTLGVDGVFGWAVLGFTVFLGLEQFIHHHHCHRPASDCRKPLGPLILLGDGLHNFLGGWPWRERLWLMSDWELRRGWPRPPTKFPRNWGILRRLCTRVGRSGGRCFLISFRLCSSRWGGSRPTPFRLEEASIFSSLLRPGTFCISAPPISFPKSTNTDPRP